MKNPLLYRKRIIPDECILLKDDVILECDEHHLITSWSAIHPKKDLHHGSSIYYLDDGYKISKFCSSDGSILYWYCDIIEHEYNESTNELIVTDLLADVIVYPDGFVKVVDIDELVTAYDDGSLEIEKLKASLLKLSRLLEIIYSKGLNTLTDRLP